MKSVLSFRLLIAVLSVFSLSAEFAVADVPVVEWEKTFGGPASDVGYCVQQTLDGGYVIAGVTNRYEKAGDVYLVKTDSYGNMQWQRTFGGAYSDEGSSVQQTLDGGYIVAGGINYYGPGDGDVYLVKTDSYGNMQWEKTFGGAAFDDGGSVQQTLDGGYIVAGGTESYGAGSSDVYLVKTDSSGSVQWQQTFGGPSWDYANSVQQTLDGGYIVGGKTGSYGAGSSDVYLVKTDSSGNIQWQKTFGGPSADVGWSVQQTLDGGYIVAGVTMPYAWWAHMYLVKTDSSGNMQWQKTFGDESSLWHYSVQQTFDGGYIVATGIYEAFTSFNVGLVKTDSSGNMLWQKTFGGTGYDVGYSVQQTLDGGYIVAGVTSGDVYLVKLGPEEPPEQAWSFVQISDTHIGWTKKDPRTGKIIVDARERLAAAIDDIVKQSPLPDFILVTGDVADVGCPYLDSCSLAYADFTLSLRRALELGIEVITVPGNHDYMGFCWANRLECYFSGLTEVDACGEICSWETEHGDFYFIGLDTGSGQPRGDGFSDTQWQAFLDSPAGQSNKPKIIFMHHPSIETSKAGDWTFDGHKQDFLDFCDPANNHNVKLVLAGHTHDDEILDIHGNPLTVGSTTYPQFIQTPSVGKEDDLFGDDVPGYRVINVNGSQVSPQEYIQYTEYMKDCVKACKYSPGTLHVYDSLGNHVGIIAAGEVEQEIEHSFYFHHYVIPTEDGDQVLPEEVIIFDPSDNYVYEIIGTEEGTYRLDITSAIGGEEIAFEATDISTSAGERHVYTVNWEALAVGEEGVTLSIDADGDGVFERTVIADKDLTAEEFALQTETVIDFEPDVLNLTSRGKVVTVYIELPEGFDVSQIDVSEVKLNDSVPALSKPVEIGDYDIDGVPDLMVKFDCGQVAEVLEAGRQTVTLTGRLGDETLFGGIDTIRVIGAGGGAAAEPELESVVPQENTTPKQKKPATTESDADDTEEAFDVQEGVAFMLLEACQTISELGPGNFNSEEAAIELTTTIDAMFTMLDDGLYFEALLVLDNDVLQRIDGCANTGGPDEDDWITSVEGQALVYPLVVETMELLERLI